MTPNEYRKKHKRCGMCQYWHTTCEWEYHELPGNCTVKQMDKYNNQGRFCKVYKAKEFEE